MKKTALTLYLNDGTFSCLFNVN